MAEIQRLPPDGGAKGGREGFKEAGAGGLVYGGKIEDEAGVREFEFLEELAEAAGAEDVGVGEDPDGPMALVAPV